MGLRIISAITLATPLSAREESPLRRAQLFLSRVVVGPLRGKQLWKTNVEEPSCGFHFLMRISRRKARHHKKSSC